MKVFILLSIVAGAFAVRDCPANQHYESCGTACPLTCDNYNNPPKACVLMCNPGCHCDKDYVKTEGGECVLPENCPNRASVEEKCLAEPEPGMCLGYFPMFHYDAESGTCKKFIYGGCQGNENRYASEEDCLVHCAGVKPRQSSSDVCSLPSETGFCKAYFPRYYFNKASGQCERFVYGGCGGNENNFKTQEDCQKSCGNSANGVCGENEQYTSCGTACPLTCDNYKNPPRVCTLQCIIGCQCAQGYLKTADGRCVLPENCPTRSEEKSCFAEPDGGMCRGYFPMFHYDYKSGTCKEFIYGGCQGNGNRYATEEECLLNCNGMKPWESSSDVCSLPSETGFCRGNFPRYFFNKASGQCEEFVYGGCGGNENNFETREDCQKSCHSRLNGVCGENEQYTSCGTACPLTCDNYKNPPRVCTLQCIIGCQCAQGYIKTADGRCVLPENCPTKSLQSALDRPDCDKAPEVGVCRARIPRFYYDQQAGMCKTFIYGGCGGNRNNFESEFDCLNKCGASGNAPCEQEKVVGPCKAAFPRYFFNKQTGQCEKFIYGGCMGNGNNFMSQDKCESACVA